MGSTLKYDSFEAILLLAPSVISQYRKFLWDSNQPRHREAEQVICVRIRVKYLCQDVAIYFLCDKL